MLFTSVVMRVIRPAVENLSMLEKEKVWILANMAWRRLAAKPVEAVAASLAAATPKNRLAMASSTMTRP